MSSTLDNVTAKIPDIVTAADRVSDSIGNATAKIPDIVNMGNRISDSINNATSTLPELMIRFDRTNSNVQQIVVTFNSFLDKISTGYIVGTVSAMVGASLGLAAVFVSSRYWINRLCIDKTATQADIQDLSERLTALGESLKALAPTHTTVTIPQ